MSEIKIIEKVKGSGKWVDIYFKDGTENSTKWCYMEEVIQFSLDDLYTNGLKGAACIWGEHHPKAIFRTIKESTEQEND